MPDQVLLSDTLRISCFRVRSGQNLPLGPTPALDYARWKASAGNTQEMKTWIRRQAASGKPLNVHAVLRERPDLLAKAYAGAQPRGWRRCLLDAGVDPYRMVHEHTTEVQCRICGEWRTLLERHLQCVHGTASLEYLDEYGPNCELSSESFRVARFSNKRVLGIRHWEKLWSRYQVIDWLLLLHEKGHDLNYFHVQQNARQLACAALCVFPSWDDALKAAGLDPAVVRAVGPFRTWTQKQVLQQLRVFVKATKATTPTLPSDLRAAALRHFTTLELAAAAAGVELEAICPRAVFKGGAVKAVVKAIRSLEGLKGRERREQLDKIHHGDPMARRIIMNHYDSLHQLALAEGIDPAVVAKAGLP